MTLVYKVVLVVVLSTEPGMNEVLLYEFPTWSACKEKEAALIIGMAGKNGKDFVTADCRKDVRVAMGTR